MWQLVGASNPVQKQGSPGSVPGRLDSSLSLPPGEGSQSVVHSHHGSDIGTQTAQVHWEPNRLGTHFSCTHEGHRSCDLQSSAVMEGGSSFWPWLRAGFPQQWPRNQIAPTGEPPRASFRLGAGSTRFLGAVFSFAVSSFSSTLHQRGCTCSECSLYTRCNTSSYGLFKNPVNRTDGYLLFPGEETKAQREKLTWPVSAGAGI